MGYKNKLKENINETGLMMKVLCYGRGVVTITVGIVKFLLDFKGNKNESSGIVNVIPQKKKRQNFGQ